MNTNAHTYCVNRRQPPKQAVKIIIFDYAVTTFLSGEGAKSPPQTPPPLVCTHGLIFNAIANCVYHMPRPVTASPSAAGCQLRLLNYFQCPQCLLRVS